MFKKTSKSKKNILQGAFTAGYPRKVGRSQPAPACPDCSGIARGLLGDCSGIINILNIKKIIIDTYASPQDEICPEKNRDKLRGFFQQLVPIFFGTKREAL